jgi:septum formation protein
VRFILASASPARLATLRRAGVDPEVIVSGVDEDSVTAPDAATLVQHLAEAKADAVAERIDGAALVLGCDSLLEFDGAALGKPGDAETAAERWRSLRGRSGVLHTGHCLHDTGHGTSASATASTVVHFADVSDEEIDVYCASGEPATVAGAFTIDGLGGWFVTGVEGDPHTVVGVSLPLLRDLLARLGYRLTELGYPTA